MEQKVLSIREILASDANVILQVSSDDLKMFAQDILIGAKSVAMLEAETAASGDQLLTIDEASKLLAVSKMTLYRWDQSGVLKKLEIGGKRRYRKSDIDRLIGCKIWSTMGCLNQPKGKFSLLVEAELPVDESSKRL